MSKIVPKNTTKIEITVNLAVIDEKFKPIEEI